MQSVLQSVLANHVWAGTTSIPCNFIVYVRMHQPWMSAMNEIVATHRSLADDAENNRVEDTDAGDRVHTLGDRIDDRSILLRNPTP